MTERGRARGFTLIELMVVISIIAVLFAIVIPAFAKTRIQAQLAACEQNVRNLANALQIYDTSEHKYPNPNGAKIPSAILFPNYISPMPICPATKLEYGYEVNATNNNYTVYCSGNIHNLGSGGVVGVGFPQYTPSVGIQLK